MSDVNLIKELRERTNAPVGKCAQALKDASNDIDKAVELLKVRGVISAGNVASRVASEGTVATYVHGGKIAVMVEVNCETDFVARSPEFLQFVNDLMLHIVASRPRYVSRSNIPADDEFAQRRIFEAQLREQGKPEQAWPKIIDGKMKSWFSEIVLLDQESVVHAKRTIEQLRVELVAKCGENVQIRRFMVWGLGEGLARRNVDFVSEVSTLVSA